MASQVPAKKNVAFTLYFSLYKNDGSIIANPGTITKKVSIDGAAVADISNAITEEDTTYGQCSVVLSADEMNGDAIWVYIKDDTSGCVPFTATIYTAGQTMDEIKSDTAAILTDTGTTLDTLIKDIPTVSEFEARTLAAADYTIVSDLPTPLDAAGVRTAVGLATANLDTQLADIPTVAEMEARTLVAASYFDPAADVVAHVTLVDTTTTNTDMVAAAPSAATIADAVWDEASTGHTDAGKAGAQVWTDIDAIAVDVAGLDGAAMRGTDSAALASVCTESRLAELDAANLIADVAAIKSDTGTTGVIVKTNNDKSAYTLHSDYDAAKTAITTGTTIGDGDSLGANTVLLWLRRMKWVLTGKMSVTDADGSFTLTKDNGTTAAGTGSITDDSTTTVRTVITWA